MHYCSLFPVVIFHLVAGFGDQIPTAGRVPGPFQVPELSTTPGPFGPGPARNEGTIPGIGVAMPLSVPLDSSNQGEQKPPMTGSLPPPLPPGPHPSYRMSNQQQLYQQNPQHQSIPQQMQFPPNMPQMQPPPHLQHPHLPRPPQQMQPLNMGSNVPSSMPGPGPMPPMVRDNRNATVSHP